MRSAKHFNKCPVYPGNKCGCEIRGYSYTAVIASVAWIAEFLVALTLADSSAAMIDSAHAAMHSAEYGLAILIIWLISCYSFSFQKEKQIRAWLGTFYFAALLFAIGSIIYFEAMPKWHQETPVAAGYMFLAGVIGVSGNFGMLKVIRRTKKILHTHDGTRHDHDITEWFSLHILSDIILSLVVILAALWMLAAELFPLLPSNHKIDPALTFLSAIWIAFLGFRLFIGKTVRNL